MKALVIIDMLKDFVDGALANERAVEIIQPIRDLIDYAHDHPHDWLVVYANDAHRPTDPELRVWGPHAMKGDPGAEVIDALRPTISDVVSEKQNYGAFSGHATAFGPQELGALLASWEIDEVVLVGQHTHICVRHSSYEALQYGFDITVPTDAVCAFEGVNEDDALEYLRDVYGAVLTTTDAIIEAGVTA